MTERTFKETKSALVILLSGVILVSNLTGLSYIDVGEHVYIDLSMIPAAAVLMYSGYRKAIIFGIAWGILSCFTHPLAAYDSYFTTLFSQVVFSLAVVYARKLGKRKQFKGHANFVVMFALVTHSLIFDIGVFSLLKVVSWHDDIPFKLILVKVALTLFMYYMALSFVSNQLRQVHVANKVKRSEV